jgi:hypothetical protein
MGLGRTRNLGKTETAEKGHHVTDDETLCEHYELSEGCGTGLKIVKSLQCILNR